MSAVLSSFLLVSKLRFREVQKALEVKGSPASIFNPLVFPACHKAWRSRAAQPQPLTHWLWLPDRAWSLLVSYCNFLMEYGESVVIKLVSFYRNQSLEEPEVSPSHFLFRMKSNKFHESSSVTRDICSIQLLKKECLFGALSAMCPLDQPYNYWKLNTVGDTAFCWLKAYLNQVSSLLKPTKTCCRFFLGWLFCADF